MKTVLAPRSPGCAVVLALLLLVIGFIVGNGYHTRQESPPSDGVRARKAAALPPLVKGLRASPDDRMLAFTGVYDRSQYAARFVLDLHTGKFSVADSPAGWQDYITQWSPDSRSILFEREKIPHPVDDATPGIYEERVQPGDATPKRAEPQLVTKGLAPNGEKVIAGLRAPDGKLLVRTRPDSKSLYEVHGGNIRLIDRAAANYLQIRPVREKNKTVYYVVRDVPGQREAVALYRVQDGKARRLSDVWQDVIWVYLAENVRWMIVCRQAENGNDWAWTLYQVAPAGIRLVKSASVPGDVNSVYWSPDLKYILGSGGRSLWIIPIPSLQVHRLGTRQDWNADDAAWLSRRNLVIVAAGGKLWEVTVPAGTQRELWKFPPKYWR
ncbi:MAG: hypothetical protein M3347_10105 [Armatimonadota bacterium]|nr:hypothetical protein [Armatimonadota bacterium]